MELAVLQAGPGFNLLGGGPLGRRLLGGAQHGPAVLPAHLGVGGAVPHSRAPHPLLGQGLLLVLRVPAQELHHVPLVHKGAPEIADDQVQQVHPEAAAYHAQHGPQDKLHHRVHFGGLAKFLLEGLRHVHLHASGGRGDFLQPHGGSPFRRAGVNAQIAVLQGQGGQQQPRRQDQHPRQRQAGGAGNPPGGQASHAPVQLQVVVQPLDAPVGRAQQQVQRRPNQAELLQQGAAVQRAVEKGRQGQGRQGRGGPVHHGLHRLLREAVLPPEKAHQRHGHGRRRVAQQQPGQAAASQAPGQVEHQLAAHLGAHIRGRQGQDGEKPPPHPPRQGAVPL